MFIYIIFIYIFINKKYIYGINLGNKVAESNETLTRVWKTSKHLMSKHLLEVSSIRTPNKEKRYLLSA